MCIVFKKMMGSQMTLYALSLWDCQGIEDGIHHSPDDKLSSFILSLVMITHIRASYD